MIKQYYKERMWIPGMPHFNNLPEWYKKELEDSLQLGVWLFNKALKEFGMTFKKFENFNAYKESLK